MHRARRKIALIRFHSGPPFAGSRMAPLSGPHRVLRLESDVGRGRPRRPGPSDSNARPGRGPYWSWPALVPGGRPDPIRVTRMLWSLGERRDHPKRPGPEQSRKMHTRHLLLRHALAAWMCGKTVLERVQFRYFSGPSCHLWQSPLTRMASPLFGYAASF